MIAQFLLCVYHTRNIMSELFWGLFGGGLFCMFISISAFIQQKKILKNGLRTNAEVVRHIRESGAATRVGTSFFTVVRYNIDGRVYETKSGVGHSSPKYKIGETVEIYYRKDNPRMIAIVNEDDNYVIPIISAVIGLGLLVASFLYTRGFF